MMTWSSRIACAAFAFVFASAAEAGPGEHGKNAGAVYVKAKEIKWVPTPPELPKGAQMVVLLGDPFKSGEFAVRLKMPDGYKIPLHWHTQAEQLTVLSGMLVLRQGDAKAAAHDLAAGDYHYLPSKIHHAAEAKGETVVQLNGSGPFDINYVNAADRPSPKSATK